MCAVRALWISCCNHFYLLNYVKPFFFILPSLYLFLSPFSVSVTVSTCEYNWYNESAGIQKK